MNHPPVLPRPRHAARAASRTRRTLAPLAGLAVFLAAAIGLAPAAWATPPPPEPSFAPATPLPPPAAVPAHFPPWAVAAILAATVVLSVATTLITLALEHSRRAGREAEAAAAARPSRAAPFPPLASHFGPAEILSSHPARDRA